MVDAVYVHVPFCRHRCGYCNFTLVADRDDLIDRYIAAIGRELQRVEPGQTLRTLFLGGGTPTHLAGGQLSALLELLDRQFCITTETEFSVEANPIDIDEDKAKRLRDAGVSRVSLGAQSWHSEKLKHLERDHDERTIERACEAIRNAGIPSLSIDLIFGAPHETKANWANDLRRCVAQQPNHVSTYGLTYERGTRFWTRKQKLELQPVAEDIELWMYETAIDELSSGGWEHYEVSNFAQPGHRCRHNEAYWTGRSFEAFGPGAARYIDGTRSVNHRSTTTYLKRIEAGVSPVAESECLSLEDQLRERFVFGMRRLEGVDLSELFRATKINADELLQPALDRSIAAGLLEREDTRVRLTRAGLVVSDSLWPEFL